MRSDDPTFLFVMMLMFRVPPPNSSVFCSTTGTLLLQQTARLLYMCILDNTVVYHLVRVVLILYCISLVGGVGVASNGLRHAWTDDLLTSLVLYDHTNTPRVCWVDTSQGIWSRIPGYQI